MFVALYTVHMLFVQPIDCTTCVQKKSSSDEKHATSFRSVAPCVHLLMNIIIIFSLSLEIWANGTRYDEHKFINNLFEL